MTRIHRIRPSAHCQTTSLPLINVGLLLALCLFNPPLEVTRDGYLALHGRNKDGRLSEQVPHLLQRPFRRFGKDAPEIYRVGEVADLFIYG